jgi:hypothetical protein
MNTPRCTFRTFPWYANSRFGLACHTCHLWLYAGTVVEGATRARITRVAPYCETRCVSTCQRSRAPKCGEAREYDYWASVRTPEVVSYSVVPYCAAPVVSA